MADEAKPEEVKENKLLNWVKAKFKRSRVVTPTLLQMEAVECGAASLGIVLHYHGRIASLEELRVKCGVSRDGSKASNIMKAARTYGLKVKGFRKEPKDLRDLPLPMILFWNFNHFLVLEGFKKGKVYVNDPMTGPRVITEEELNEAFSGVVLVFEVGPEFEKGGEKQSLAAGLFRRMPGVKGGLLFAFFASLALVVPKLVVPTFSKVFVDEVLIGDRIEWLTALLWGLAGVMTVLAVITGLQRHYLLRMETKLSISESSKFFWHVLRLPMEFYNQRFGGEIGHRVGINDNVAQLIAQVIATNLLNFILIGFYGILMWQYDPILTMLGVMIALWNIAFLQFVSRKRTDQNHRLLQSQGKMVGTSQSGLQLIETLKASAEEADFFTKWCGQQVKVINAEQKLGHSTQYLNNVPIFLTALSTVIILGIGSLRIISGNLSVGLLIAFQLLMANFLGPVNMMVALGGTLQEVEGDLNRLDDVLSNDIDKQFESASSNAQIGGAGELNRKLLSEEDLRELDEDELSPSRLKLTGAVELDKIAFGYSILDDPLIKDFSLTLKPGARVALVGGSGSGKSTISRVIGGLYQPWDGVVRFDGMARNEIPRDIINNTLAMVDQNIFVFHGTIRDNLTMWDETIPQGRVVQAARDACLHDIVSSRPGGYDSIVEEGGRNFSGGQLQRMEIARALVNDPSILLLDEATSALDPTTEKLVDDNLRRRGCTCIIVAHRLSTIRDCDEIIVLHYGKVVQRGTHEELLEEGGYYADLIKTA